MPRVYRIKDFDHDSEEEQVYVNRLKDHVREHSFTNLPHKHDFYLFILVTKGSGLHEIDFRKYPVKPGSIFLMQPGQMHSWKLSEDIDGFVFFHSREFYERGYTQAEIQQFSFFKSFQSVPYVNVGKKVILNLESIMEEMFAEFKSGLQYKFTRIHALISLAYIGVSRVYSAGEPLKSPKYLGIFSAFEQLLEQNYREQKLPRFYASELNITEKHLNRICRDCVEKTSTQLIAERVLLEAKRFLSQHQKNITEIAFDLGFNDLSYFVRFFKKHTGLTPLKFQEKYFPGV